MLALSLLIEEKDLGEGTNWLEQQQSGVLKSLRQWLLTKSNGGISAFNKPVKLVLACPGRISTPFTEAVLKILIFILKAEGSEPQVQAQE